MARLKVFQATLGFHDSVVAVSSRPKALEAWGVRQDLFAEGLAREADDPQAIKAARAQPGTPLLRPIGAGGGFKAEPAGAPHLPKPKPAPDRSRLAAAERAVAALAEEETGLTRDFAANRRALETAAAAARDDLAARQKRARQALMRARAAYRKAGGERD
jgi:hypothetical protein